MQADEPADLIICNTTAQDLPCVFSLFDYAISLQGKNGYKVWDHIDKAGLIKDVEDGCQYKIQENANVLCIFSIQYGDPFIWRGRDKNDAIYLHRIVANPQFKGQRQFEKVLSWAVKHALTNHLSYVRMDTWADNLKIIEYYKAFGFNILETYVTPNAVELPVQNRNIAVALLELRITDLAKKYN